MRVLKFILPLLLIGPLSYGQLGNLSKGADALTEKRVRKVEKSLVFKTISFDGSSADCQRTNDDQRKKLSKKKNVIEAIALLENILEANYQKVKNDEQIDSNPGTRENSLLKTISTDGKFINRDKYVEELAFYKYYFGKKREEGEAAIKIAADKKKRAADEKKIADYEARMAQREKEVREEEIAKEEKRRALDAERAAEAKRIAEEKRVAKENIAKRKEANRIADSTAWANLTPGERVLAKAKSHYEKAKKTGYYHQTTFNPTYESLADAQALGVSTDKIVPYLEGLKKIAGKSKGRAIISLEDLKYMSTASQKERKAKMESLEATIEKQKPSKANAATLRKQYQWLIDNSRYYMEDYYFRSSYLNKAENGLLELELEFGDTDAACALLYKKQRDRFDRAYRGGQCSAWVDIKEASLRAEKAKERQAVVAQWRKDNPGMIKMKSLLGEFSSDVEDYLGKPLKNRDDIRTYSTSDGTYEIGYSNSRAILIEFTPSKNIKFDKELLSSSGGLIDHKDNMSGICTGSQEEDNIGGLKTFSFEWNCDSGSTSITFFGDNGKLVQITAL